jgi:preprotein translocase subunit YajC
MPSLFAAVPLLFAENAPAANPNGGGSGPMNLLPLLLAAGLWGYFLLFRPQQQQEKKRKEMISALKKNDRVMTTGGLYGTVVSVDNEQDRVVLRVDDDRGVKLTFSKSAVGRLIDTTADKASESA